jgi:hypothetical protein
MNTKQWTPIQIAFLLAFGSVQAVADSGWYYDKDRDTIVFTAEGSRSNYILWVANSSVQLCRLPAAGVAHTPWDSPLTSPPERVENITWLELSGTTGHALPTGPLDVGGADNSCFAP